MAHHWSTQFHKVPGDGGLSKDVTFLKKCGIAAQGTGQRAVVLVQSGAWSPPHRGHVEALQVAAKALPSNLVISGVILIPSSDYKVRDKLGDGPLPFMSESKQGTHELRMQSKQNPPFEQKVVKGALPFELRADLMREIATDMKLEWPVHVSEVEQSRGLYYLGCLENFSHAAAKELSADLIPLLVWVTGSDRPGPLYKRFDGDGVDGVVVVPRAGDELMPLPEWIASDPLRVVSSPLSNGGDAFSSTKLRDAVESILGPSDCAVDDAIQCAIEDVVQPYMTPRAAHTYAQALKERVYTSPFSGSRVPQEFTIFAGPSCLPCRQLRRHTTFFATTLYVKLYSAINSRHSGV